MTLGSVARRDRRTRRWPRRPACRGSSPPARSRVLRWPRTLYPPAFAALTHWGGAAPGTGTHRGHSGGRAGLHRLRATDRRTRVGRVLAQRLRQSSRCRWRSPSCCTASACAPHGRPRSRAHLTDDHRSALAGDATPCYASGRFVAVVAAMTLAGFAIYAAVINLVPLLVESGFSTQRAATVLAVGGVGQVAGRLAYAPVLGRADAGHQGDAWCWWSPRPPPSASPPSPSRSSRCA